MKTCVLAVIVLGCCLAASIGAGKAGLPRHDTIQTASGPLTVSPIEHATFVMQWSGITIVVDPVGGKASFADHPTPDLILITDIHGDHLSVETVAAIRQESTMIVCPAAVADEFPEQRRSQLTVLANGERLEWRGIVVTALPMYNLTAERKQFHVKGRGNGYLLDFSGTRVYVAGDTEDIPEMRALEDIDVAFVPMNLPYTMDVAQAADAVLAFKPRVVYPYHYRGKGGLSDLDKFTAIVAKNPEIEVRRLAWY